jgi:hypothetical protein
MAKGQLSANRWTIRTGPADPMEASTAVHDIIVPTTGWANAEVDGPDRPAAASNDVRLTGVIFVRDFDVHEHPLGTTTVKVKSNRLMSEPQINRVKATLFGDVRA